MLKPERDRFRVSNSIIAYEAEGTRFLDTASDTRIKYYVFLKFLRKHDFQPELHVQRKY